MRDHELYVNPSRRGSADNERMRQQLAHEGQRVLETEQTLCYCCANRYNLIIKSSVYWKTAHLAVLRCDLASCYVSAAAPHTMLYHFAWEPLPRTKTSLILE